MARYFLELSYNGKGYAGFQRQKNARAIQDEIEKALSLILHEPVRTTGSSRTDAGVHARQNFVHFDGPEALPENALYSLNAILSRQISVLSLFQVPSKAHARYDACSRSYRYCIYTLKDPFLQDFGYFYPYPLNLEALRQAALLVLGNVDFQAFCKRNPQVKQYQCRILEASWEETGAHTLEFRVTADRFLRGMVRGLVGTMLRVGTQKLSLEDFSAILKSGDCSRVDFSSAPQGLFLERVQYRPFPPAPG